MTTNQSKPFNVAVGKAPGAEDQVALVAVEGYLDAHTSVDFDGEMERWLRDGYVRFVLDATQLHFISSAGIGGLMRLVQEARRRGGELVLLRPAEKVYDVLELLGFAQILVFCDSTDDAIKHLTTQI